MTVLIVLFGSLAVFRALGFAGVDFFETWLSSARAALATMFVFTAISHFKTRAICPHYDRVMKNHAKC